MLTHHTCRLVSPAAEKSDWLNNLLKKLWPKMKEAIAESIRQSLQPTLDYYRPGFLNKLAVRRCSVAAGSARSGVVIVTRVVSRVSTD